MPSFPSRAVVTAAMALACAVAPIREAPAQAQGLKLQRSLGTPPSGRDPGLPTFVTADRIEGLGEFEVQAIGNAELRRGDLSLIAERIRYLPEADEAEAVGSVRLRMGRDEVTGPRLRLRLGDAIGIFVRPTYRLAPRPRRLSTGVVGPTITASEAPPTIEVEGRGEAEAFRFDGAGHYRVTDGTYTTCKPGQNDWYFEARELDIDTNREVGTARYARINFFGVPTPRVPWFDFSLNNDRKTGFLLPTIGVQNRAGTQIALPFYLNIAPNYDATITSRYMDLRGVQFVNEFRFLNPRFAGEARYDVLPKDQVTGTNRYATGLLANWNLLSGWSGAINYQSVSDDNYYRDLSTQLSVATQPYLLQDASVNYAAAWWTAGLRWQRFQTLQDPLNPIAEPYFREPQFTLSAAKPAVGRFDLALDGEYVDFTSKTIVPAGKRAIAYPNVALPLVASYGFFTPKIGWHATAYNLRGPPGSIADKSLSRTLPIASVDTGLFFERPLQLGGSDLIQTFEPRVYYLYVPFTDQSRFPVFDTSTADLSITQLFQENLFVGGDRIANANQISVAATSRFVRARDGQELLRAIIGQRYYFTEQKVFIPGQPIRTESVSPVIFGLAGRVAPNWIAELGVQYRTVAGGSIDKLNAGVRYTPAPAAVASISYRYTAENLTAGTAAINSIDFAAQWPLGRGFYGVGRYSYDIKGDQPVETLIGLEYNGGCWIVRGLAHRFQTATALETTAFYLQLEFNGFARIGSNPIDVLRRNIPGYSLINQAPPVNGSTDNGLLGGVSSTAYPFSQ